MSIQLLRCRTGEGLDGKGTTEMSPKELDELRNFFVDESIRLQQDWKKGIKMHKASEILGNVLEAVGGRGE